MESVYATIQLAHPLCAARTHAVHLWNTCSETLAERSHRTLTI